MATMACYPTFEQQTSNNNNNNRSSTGVVSSNNNNNSNNQQQQQKDYSKPLHVDCSVEYELPNQARPPGKSEPLLMIHPCFYRRAESQRRSPFINNLPQTVVQQQIQQTRRTSSRNTSSNTNNNSNTSTTNNSNSTTTNNTLLLQQQRYAAQQQQMRYMEQVQQQQQVYQQTAMVSAAAWNIDQNSAAIYCKPPTTRSTRRNSRKNTSAAVIATAAASVSSTVAAVAKELVINRTGSDYTSSSADSGISGVLWTDIDRSPADQQKLVYQQQQHQQNGLGNMDTINLPAHTSDKNLIHESSQPSQAPPTSRRGGYSLRSDSNNGDLAELLAAACGAEHLPPLPKIGSGPGKTLPPSQPQSSTTSHQQQQQHHHHQQQQQQQQQHGAMCQQIGGRCVCLPRSQQQPAVGVAAVACRSCRSQQLPPQITQAYQHQVSSQQANSTQQQIQQQHQQQQPWPAQFAHPPAAVPATACEPEPAAAASGQVRRAWSRSGPTPSAKRSRVSQQQQQQQQSITTNQQLITTTTTFPSSSPWVNTTNPFLESNTPSVWPQQQQQRQTTSCGLSSSNNNNNNNNSSNGKDCGASMCKVCCPNTANTTGTSNNTVLTPHIQQQQQTSFQQQQQQTTQDSTQQWNASYYCRGASEDGGRMLWNNENMLRLFQV